MFASVQTDRETETERQRHRHRQRHIQTQTDYHYHYCYCYHYYLQRAMSGAAASQSVEAAMDAVELQALQEAVAASLIMEDIEAASQAMVEVGQSESQPTKETEAQTVSQAATVEVGQSEILLPVRQQLKEMNKTLQKMLVLQKDQGETNYFMEQRQYD